MRIFLFFLILTRLIALGFASDCSFVENYSVSLTHKMTITVNSIGKGEVKGYRIALNSGKFENWLLNPSSNNPRQKTLKCSTVRKFLILKSTNSNIVKTVRIPLSRTGTSSDLSESFPGTVPSQLVLIRILHHELYLIQVKIGDHWYVSALELDSQLKASKIRHESSQMSNFLPLLKRNGIEGILIPSDSSLYPQLKIAFGFKFCHGAHLLSRTGLEEAAQSRPYIFFSPPNEEVLGAQQRAFQVNDKNIILSEVLVDGVHYVFGNELHKKLIELGFRDPHERNNNFYLRIQRVLKSKFVLLPNHPEFYRVRLGTQQSNKGIVLYQSDELQMKLKECPQTFSMGSLPDVFASGRLALDLNGEQIELKEVTLGDRQYVYGIDLTQQLIKSKLLNEAYKRIFLRRLLACLKNTRTISSEDSEFLRLKANMRNNGRIVLYDSLALQECIQEHPDLLEFHLGGGDEN